MQKLLDLMTGLRKIRENIPRRQTVSSVFKERREFVSPPHSFPNAPHVVAC